MVIDSGEVDLSTGRNAAKRGGVEAVLAKDTLGCVEDASLGVGRNGGIHTFVLIVRLIARFRQEFLFNEW